MKKKKRIYAIGHRNPDTDSICSAIGYAYLKNKMSDDNVIAARTGQLNAETKFVLDYFGMKAPVLLTDVYPRVKDIMVSNHVVVKETDNLRHLGEVMRKNNLRSVPVTDEEEHLTGIVTVSDLAKRYFQELGMQTISDLGVSLRDVIAVIDGEVIISGDENLLITGGVKIAAGSSNSVHEHIQDGDIVIIGDRHDDTVIECIKKEIACLIVTGSGRLDSEATQLAEELGRLVVVTPYDTYTTARLINQCVPVSQLMQKSLICFHPMDLVSNIKGEIAKHNYRNYPVVEGEHLIGLITHDQLLVPEPEKLILIDHNERGQSVEGIEWAKVVEIVDHHRLGGIETSEPIYTYQEPVGSTGTIVAGMYWAHNIPMIKEVAGLLLSAIISDTVLFKSLTCTQKDRDYAEKLAEIAEVDLHEYGMEMLKAGSSIGNMSPMSIARNDMKEFKFGDYNASISQISVMDTNDVMKHKDKIIDSLNNICENDGFDLSMLMVTNILEENTELLYTGSPKALIGEAFKMDASGNSIFLPGVMSRKKQIVPPLSDAVMRIQM